MWSSNHFIAEWNKGMKHITNGVTWIKSLQASDPNDWIFIIAKIKWRHTVEVMVVVLLMFQDGVMSAPMWWRGQHRTAKARMTSTAWTMASACCWWTWINTTASTILCVCVCAAFNHHVWSWMTRLFVLQVWEGLLRSQVWRPGACVSTTGRRADNSHYFLCESADYRSVWSSVLLLQMVRL